MIDYARVLSQFFIGKQWAINGNSYEGIEWLDTSTKPTQAELDALWPEVQKVDYNQAQENKRVRAYKEESDPLFFKAQRGEATLQEWEAKVAEIKTRYPYQE